MIIVPQPPWLPPMKNQLYFYLHGAGLAYLYVRTIHVLVDVSKKQLAMPKCGDFLAYLLFAPTLRMGPIYRFPDFNNNYTTALLSIAVSAPACSDCLRAIPVWRDSRALQNGRIERLSTTRHL
jgi:hypothetical protein